MEVSARNALRGKIKALVVGAVNAEVKVEVILGIKIVAMITKSSAERLGLTEGKEVYAVVKASDVIIATD
ncbi:MAG: TOBE domain-containing protein [Synechococcales cyanobacterium C42_A2020_086]|nr:TOBE domain-containing protein [Synechococcales cyanobacterium C42_A2020_086]